MLRERRKPVHVLIKEIKTVNKNELVLKIEHEIKITQYRCFIRIDTVDNDFVYLDNETAIKTAKAILEILGE